MEKKIIKKTNYLDLSENKRIECFQLLYNSKDKKFIKFIEKYNVNINSITEEDELDNFLIEAVTGDSDFYGSENQIAIVQYLIDNGIDVNHKTKARENALDIALGYSELSKISLMLVQSKNADFHKGKYIAYTAIRAYSDAWREEENQENIFKVIEELLKRNVSLKGCYEWLKHIEKDFPKIIVLIKKYGHTLASLKVQDDAEKAIVIDTTIDIDNLHNSVNAKDYSKTLKVMWQKLIPSSGQADTVQGELLRAIEKLRDEAHRNGNGNFHKDCHGLLVKYLKKYLIDKSIFGKEVVLKIKKDLRQISFKTIPYTDDDIYDFINNRIVDWYLANPKQIAHIKNDTLYC